MLTECRLAVSSTEDVLNRSNAVQPSVKNLENKFVSL